MRSKLSGSARAGNRDQSKTALLGIRLLRYFSAACDVSMMLGYNDRQAGANVIMLSLVGKG